MNYEAVIRSNDATPEPLKAHVCGTKEFREALGVVLEFHDEFAALRKSGNGVLDDAIQTIREWYGRE